MTDAEPTMANTPLPYLGPVGRAIKSSAQVRVGSRTSRRTLFFLLGADLIALVASVGIAGGLAYEFSQHFLRTPFKAFDSGELVARLGIWAALSLGLCASFYIADHYTIRRPLREDVPRIVSSLFLVLLIDGFVEFATKTGFSRVWLVSIWIVAAVTIPLARVAVRRMLDGMGLWKLKAAMLGRGSHVEAVSDGLSGDRYLGYQVIANTDAGWFADGNRTKLGNKVRDFVAQTGTEVVILVPNNEEFEHTIHLIDVLNIQMIPYAIVPPIHRLPLVGLHMQQFLSSDAVLMTVKSGLLSPVSRTLKRAFDIAAASILAVFLAPLLLVVGILVALDRGPVFFGHERVGYGGRPFRCLKFRTMLPNATAVLRNMLENDPALKAEWLTTFKLKKDPRVTAIGRLLRKTSLDELPQLFNVLAGTMSLVGPRPVVASELEEFYGEDALYYRMVLPGITGLWQISGRSDTGYTRRVHLDSWYVRNWSLWSDILILLGTLPSVLRSRGAY